jgi:hypothetical protein
MARALGRPANERRARPGDAGQQDNDTRSTMHPSSCVHAAADAEGLTTSQATDRTGGEHCRLSYTRMLWTGLKRKAAYLPG